MAGKAHKGRGPNAPPPQFNWAFASNQERLDHIAAAEADRIRFEAAVVDTGESRAKRARSVAKPPSVEAFLAAASIPTLSDAITLRNKVLECRCYSCFIRDKR